MIILKKKDIFSTENLELEKWWLLLVQINAQAGLKSR